MMIHIFLELALLSLVLQGVASGEALSSSAQISSVSRAGDETLYVLFLRPENGDGVRRIRATKKGPPCEGFFGGGEVAAVYDFNTVTLTTGSSTCRLDIQEDLPQGVDAPPGIMRGRPRRQDPSQPRWSPPP
jgi:hypothetical protein